MSLFKKIKHLFADDRQAEAPAVAAKEEAESTEPDESASAKEDKNNEELLDRLSLFKIVHGETLSRNFLEMRIYRFERPFDGVDMRDLVNGMRWLGFRMYTFSVLAGGQEHECESLQEFTRALAEGEPEGCSMMTSFGGVRVNCTIDAEGTIHLSHDSSRGVDFSPFEGMFDPEEIESGEE